jgi:Undecaprenyl-phosphate glucose phosphotransferase
MRHSSKNLKQISKSDFGLPVGIKPTFPTPAVLKKRAVLRTEISEKLAGEAALSANIFAATMRVFEFLAMAIAGLLIAQIYPGLRSGIQVEQYVLLTVIASVLFVVGNEITGSYKLQALLDPKPHLSGLVTTWIASFAAIFGLVIISKAGESYSRIWLMTWFGAGAFFMFAGRFFISAYLRHHNHDQRFNRRVLIVGGGAAAESIIATLQASPAANSSVIGVFDDRYGKRSPEHYGPISKLGKVGEIVEFVRTARIDTIIVALPLWAEDRLQDILEQLRVLPVDIRLSAHDQKVRYRPQAYSYIGNLPCIDVHDRPLSDWDNVAKSIEDKVIAVVALILLSPVFALTALAVKYDSKGPALFKQKRYGFNNELIEVYKFRSMFTEMTDAKADRLVSKGDPRVTRVGRFIRKTSLDELPQLFNVLKGELSLVGPRPHATSAKAAGSLYEQVVDGYFSRHRVKPGITGWAQINGWRGETDTEEKIRRRVEHDLYYIENWSLTFDLYILARTPLSLFKTENAY